MTRGFAAALRSAIRRFAGWPALAAAAFSVALAVLGSASPAFGQPIGPSTGSVSTGSVSTGSAYTTPIRHVVVVLQENHSFDNVLGQLCIQDHRDCNAASTGQLSNGGTIPLSRAKDKVAVVAHLQADQLTAMDGGKMDGWAQLSGCQQDQCYTQYDPTQVPALAALARAGAISDSFFSRDIVPSWGGHVDFFAQTLDGFVGDNPVHLSTAPPVGPGWGCDSNRDTGWMNPSTQTLEMVPSCVPDQTGAGPYRSSPVPYVPTFGDRLDAARRTWGIFGGLQSATAPNPKSYQWSICPSFAECLDGPQHKNMHAYTAFLNQAKAGTLPAFSLLIPGSATTDVSQHNGTSMLVGDNYVGSSVSAVQQGPDGASTTIFIYYDDCGCFYDHVTPPAGLGIRLPLVIVSPYAKPGYTDHTVATNSSILRYAEEVLGVQPVDNLDATAYDFANSFNYAQTRTAPVRFHAAAVPYSERHLKVAPDST